LSAAIVEELELVWVCCGWRTPPTAHSEGGFTHSMPRPCRAAKGLECVFPIWFTQCGSVWFTLHIFMNQTRPHCVNQMGKTHSKPLPARHGRGTAWARQCERDSSVGAADNRGKKYRCVAWEDTRRTLTTRGRSECGRGRVRNTRVNVNWWADLLRRLRIGTQFGVYQHVNMRDLWLPLWSRWELV
jgi:hypothetical protein